MSEKNITIGNETRPMTAEEEDANAGVVRNEDGTVTADEHDFLQQNQGFVDDNLNPEED